jgi:hypothetical protein
MSGVLRNMAAVPDMREQPDEERYPILGNLIWYTSGEM